jgi:hypothetical protein
MQPLIVLQKRGKVKNRPMVSQFMAKIKQKSEFLQSKIICSTTNPQIKYESTNTTKNICKFVEDLYICRRITKFNSQNI